MKKLFIGIGILVGVGLFAFLILNVDKAQQEQPLGSVNQANEYKSTTTVALTAEGTYYVTNTTTDMVTFGRAGTLGSIVITSSSLSGFTVYDGNFVATSTIADFPANATVGTYTFDVALRRGLSIKVPAAFTGNIVTTYR